MMTLGISGLVAAFILLALLLLSINLYSRWSWPVKAGTIILTTLFYAVTYLSLPPLLGWPIENDLPEKFRLIAAHVQQPDKLTKDGGAIYLWVTDVRNLVAHAPPRAYRFPYSGLMHEVVINAMAKLQKGVPQLGEFREPENPDMGLIREPARLGQVSAPVRFYDVPDPLYPDK